MLLAFDIGNSNIVLGVFKGEELITNWRIETDTNKSADEYGMLISQFFRYEGLKMSAVKDVIISTVVPSVLYTMQHMSQKDDRSEERRVGKECRSRWSPYQ